MKKVRFIAILFSSIATMAIVLSGCSSSSKGTTEKSSKSSDTVLSSKQGITFVKQVNKICSTIPKTTFTSLTIDQNTISDIDGFNERLQASEDELDRIILEFRDLDVPEELADDWETFILDHEAMRDAMPKVGELLTELVEAQQNMSNSVDLNVITQFQGRMKKIQDELAPINEDIGQRTKEIANLSKEFGFTNCSITSD